MGLKVEDVIDSHLDFYEAIDLHSVKRLMFREMNFDESIILMKSAKNASEISFTPDSETSVPDIELVMTYCFHLSKLEYLHITPESYIAPVCNAIGYLLCILKPIEGDRMELELVVHTRYISNAETFVQSVLKILNAFAACKRKEWMFTMEFVKSAEECCVNNTVIEALQKSSILPPLSELRSCTTEIIVIVSKECTIQRHEKWW